MSEDVKSLLAAISITTLDRFIEKTSKRVEPKLAEPLIEIGSEFEYVGSIGGAHEWMFLKGFDDYNRHMLQTIIYSNIETHPPKDIFKCNHKYISVAHDMSYCVHCNNLKYE